MNLTMSLCGGTLHRSVLDPVSVGLLVDFAKEPSGDPDELGGMMRLGSGEDQDFVFVGLRVVSNLNVIVQNQFVFHGSTLPRSVGTLHRSVLFPAVRQHLRCMSECSRQDLAFRGVEVEGGGAAAITPTALVLVSPDRLDQVEVEDVVDDVEGIAFHGSTLSPWV